MRLQPLWRENRGADFPRAAQLGAVRRMLPQAGGSPRVRQISPLRRVLVSLLALMVGWLIALASYALYSCIAWGNVQDAVAIAYWTALFALLGWAVFVPALILILRDRLPERSLLASSFVGAAIALAAFALLVGWWSDLWQEFLYPAYAVILGAAAGATYSLSIRGSYPPNQE